MKPQKNTKESQKDKMSFYEYKKGIFNIGNDFFC